MYFLVVEWSQVKQWFVLSLIQRDPRIHHHPSLSSSPSMSPEIGRSARLSHADLGPLPVRTKIPRKTKYLIYSSKFPMNLSSDGAIYPSVPPSPPCSPLFFDLTLIPRRWLGKGEKVIGNDFSAHSRNKTSHHSETIRVF